LGFLGVKKRLVLVRVKISEIL